MQYQIKAASKAKQEATILIKQSEVDFGITASTAESLPNPAELFLGAFASCILKNVERFSDMMKFQYRNAAIVVTATRLENPPRMDHIIYQLSIDSDDQKLNLELLKKNIEKFGTIFNTVESACTISGTISLTEDV